MSQKFEFLSGNTDIKYSKPSSSDSRTKDEEIERLTKERDELAVVNESYLRLVEIYKLDAYNLSIKKFAHFNNEDCWLYQGNGEDNLESLVCPVVISPKELSTILKERDELAANNARLREALDAAISYVLSIQMNIKYNLPIDGPKVDLPQLIIGVARKALAETPAQSVAHYKAEGLLMAADVCYDADKSEHSSDLGAKLEALAKEMEG